MHRAAKTDASSDAAQSDHVHSSSDVVQVIQSSKMIVILYCSGVASMKLIVS